MEVVYSIQLKLSTGASASSLFSTVQGDTGTRKIKATILNDDGTAFSPDSGTTAEYWSRKADGTGTQHSASISSNTVTVTLTEQDLAAPGRTYAAVVLKKGSSILAAMPFWFFNAPVPTGIDTESSNDYQMIVEATEAANSAATHAPYIRSSDLHWMVWDMEREAYVDTGVPASGVDGSVLYSTVQTLTPEQSAQARSNIGAAYDSDVTDLAGDLSDLSDDLEQLKADLKAGTQETAEYHLGFYKNANGDVCQLVNN